MALEVTMTDAEYELVEQALDERMLAIEADLITAGVASRDGVFSYSADAFDSGTPDWIHEITAELATWSRVLEAATGDSIPLPEDWADEFVEAVESHADDLDAHGKREEAGLLYSVAERVKSDQ